MNANALKGNVAAFMAQDLAREIIHRDKSLYVSQGSRIIAFPGTPPERSACMKNGSHLPDARPGQGVANSMPNKRNIPRSKIYLTKREAEVLKWLTAGKTNWEIAVLLGISERTIKFYVSNIIRKFDAMNRTHAVALAIEQGMINTG